MKIAVFSMIRNEIDIIDDFLFQLDGLFDYIYIADHESNDGTKNYIDNFCSIRDKSYVFRVSGRGYPQQKITTFFVNYIYKEVKPDWIFILDSDEFLSIRNREELIFFLEQHRAYDLLKLKWRNSYPENISGWKSLSQNRIRLCKEQSEYQKVILSSELFIKLGEVGIHRGNHSVKCKGGFIKEKVLEEPEIIHIPFRSKQQLLRKVLLGCASYYSDLSTVKTGDGYHWKDILNRVSIEGEINHKNFEKMVLFYNGHNFNTDVEFAEGTFFTNAPNNISSNKEMSDIGTSLQLYLDYERGFFNHNKNNSVIIESEGEFIELINGDNSEKIIIENYESVHEAYIVNSNNSWEEMVDTLFSLPKYTTFSAWAGHIPFALHLIKMLQPKRIVELGVHTGCSFLAMCHAIQKFDISCELYGVDHWNGDEQAGFYDGDEIFSNLSAKIQEYPFAKLLKYNFSDARERFTDGSIDLLNIDGFHSYDSVYNDFSQWLSALSDKGVILFHDITIYDEGFGVWQFWSQVKKMYPNIEFFHSCGLGVLVIGDSIPQEFTDFLNRLYEDEAFQLIYKKICANLHPIQSIRYHFLEEKKGLLQTNEELENIIIQKDNDIAQLIKKSEVSQFSSSQTREIENICAQHDNKSHKIKTLKNELSFKVKRIDQLNQHISDLETLLNDKMEDLKELNLELDISKNEIIKIKYKYHSFLLNNNFKGRYGFPIFKMIHKIRKKLHFRKLSKIIKASSLFDEEYYLKSYPDVSRNKFNPVLHYLFYGASELRNPHPLFDTFFYLKSYPDIIKSGVNPLFHYIKYGAKEHRNPNPFFDTHYYLEKVSTFDVKIENPLVHFIEFGVQNFFNPHPSFDIRSYLAENPNIVESNINPLSHFLNTRYYQRHKFQGNK